ncbi:MAG TPA: DUF4383 domain-containing protein [Natronosporangium sp.]
MAHLPVNHPARPFLRVLAGAVGLYVLVFGIVGLLETWGQSFFERGDTWVLGLKTNPAFSVLSIVAGLVIVGGAIYGRNLDHIINLYGGAVFLVAGLAMMTVLHFDLNVLNFSLSNCVVSFIIGLVLLHAGLYGKSGSPEQAEAEERLRRGALRPEQREQVVREENPLSDRDESARPA